MGRGGGWEKKGCFQERDESKNKFSTIAKLLHFLNKRKAAPERKDPAEGEHSKISADRVQPGCREESFSGISHKRLRCV